jgi:hypothetical protein
MSKVSRVYVYQGFLVSMNTCKPSLVSTSGEFYNRIAAAASVGPRNLNQEYIATMINWTGVNRKSRAEAECK